MVTLSLMLPYALSHIGSGPVNDRSLTLFASMSAIHFLRPQSGLAPISRFYVKTMFVLIHLMTQNQVTNHMIPKNT